MQQPTTVSRIGAWLVLFARGATWIGVLGYFVLFSGTSLLLSAMLADPDAAYRVAGRLAFAEASIFQFVGWTLLAWFLARRLGDGPPATAWAIWLGAVVIYVAIGIVLPGILQAAITTRLQDDPQLVSPIATGLTFFWSVAMLPLLAWLAATAHGKGAPGLRGIFAYLTGEGFGLWALFIALQLVSLLLNIAVVRLLGDGAVTTGSMLAQQAVNALRTAATVLFSIAAYREIRAAQSPAPAAFA